MIPVFDGHNDVVQRLVAAGDGAAALWRDGDGTGHLDLPRMRAGGMVGGFFALWVPDDHGVSDPASAALMEEPPFALPLPGAVPHPPALAWAVRQAAVLHRLAANGDLAIIRDAAGLDAALASRTIAAILHMEGAEALASPDDLVFWHAAGLRSLGPVWSRPTAYGHGVPFACPGDPDTGPGLTAAGRALVVACDDLRVLIDLSHLNAAGMADVARLSRQPLVATHSNAHAITPSTRNLTDRQLHMIAETRGVVGLNFAVSFLRPDGRRLPFDGHDPILRHLDHLLGILGEDGVALGSDYDGALVPPALDGADRLPALLAALAAHGLGEPLIRKIVAENWLSLLRRLWA